MFRKRGFGSHDQAFFKTQNNVKDKINANLSHVIKELQKEFPPSSQAAQSDSPLVQHLCSTVEAAFIHGLKLSYFEKVDRSRVSRDGLVLPAPCFWNILQKISHTETIKQIDKLKYVTTVIGKGRAWIRLALNEGALSSYLNSLFSKEYRKLVSYYYDSYALFLDSEHADIFLQYMQGLEIIQFDTSFNSSMLNLWTKTPIELSGLIPPSTSTPLYAGLAARVDNNNHPMQFSMVNKPHINLSPSQSSNYSRSHPQKQSSLKPNTSARKSSNSSDMSRKTERVPSIEVTEDKATDKNGETVPPILHTRQLMKKRKRKKRMKRNKGRSWSSLSSGESSTTSYASSCNNTPRSGSICSTPPVMVLTKNSADVEILPEGNLPRQNSFLRKNSKNDTNDNSMMNSSPKNEQKHSGNMTSLKNENILNNTQYNKHKSKDTIFCDHNNGSFLNMKTNVLVNSTHNEEPVSILEESTSSQVSTDGTHMIQKIGQQMELQGAYKLSYLTSSSGDELADQQTDNLMQSESSAVDIYKPPTTEDTNLNRSYSRSGNSLSNATGWSSEVSTTTSINASNAAITNLQQQRVSSPSVQSTGSLSTHASVSSQLSKSNQHSDDIFIRREGYLQKMGVQLKQWRKRWFILRDKTLNYYKDKKSSDILGTFNLSEVKSVTEETDEKGSFNICLQMYDDVQHRLKCDKKAELLDWKQDFQQVINGPTEETTTDGVNKSDNNVPSSYVDEYEVISVRNHLLHNVTTSWHSSMLAHMCKIAHEKGFDTQNYQCADCATPIGIIYSRPRLCNFTGQNYCSQCHLNDESIIPARVIHNWDFRKHKVAKRSKAFLDQVFSDPVINLNDANPVIYKYVDEMGKLLQLRTQLMHIKPYLQTCRKMHPDEIFTRLKTRLHFLEDAHLYSAKDLCHVQDKDLSSTLSKIINYGVKHVLACSMCMAKGFLCEICHKDEVIFPFQTDTTVQCNECKSLFHKYCKTDSIKCPKCERRQKRLQSLQDTSNYFSDSDKTEAESDEEFNT